MNSIYLVLDMQNDLVHPDGASGKSPLGEQVVERDVVARTANAIASARTAGIPIGFVRIAFSDDYREANRASKVFGPIAENGILKMAEWGGAIHRALAPATGDWDIVKHRVSPFYQTRLELLLRMHRIERIYCSGVSTQAVVQATVRDAHDRDFDVVLLEDCCASVSQSDHTSSVAALSRFCRVFSSSELPDGWE